MVAARSAPKPGIGISRPSSGYGTLYRPCSPPVTEFHLKQMAQTICANANVSIGEIDARRATQNRPNTSAQSGCVAAAAARATAKEHAVGLHQDGASVGADAEVGGVAEGDETGVAEQQIEARCEQGEYGDVGRQERVVARSEPRHASGCNEHEGGPGHTPESGHRFHHFSGRPSSPPGVRRARAPSARTRRRWRSPAAPECRTPAPGRR